jgi:transcription factor IIIB 90 kDa subunit
MPDCRSTDVVEDGGSWICNSCGQIVSEGNPYVSDQQWTENAAGASQPQGTFVGIGQTHSRTTVNLPGGRGRGLLGGVHDGGNDGAKTRNSARILIQDFATRFGIVDSVVQSASAIFGLALQHSFLSGRTLESVAAVCLYIACRRVRDTDSRASSIMLIDLAETIPMNVFLLGSIYTKMVDKVGLRSKTDRNEKVEAMPPETLVSRFAQELEFGRDTGIIKKDAVDIVRRMNRDWMTTGRRQAGICGAAIILAARMNNYRRTVREVVLVAKVTEITINKRLEEFQFTESSNLTVEAFKNGTIRDALKETDPPAYYRAMGTGPQKKKRKRGRPKKATVETAAEIEGDDEDDSDGQSAARRVRFDMEGFKIPPIPSRTLPIDPQLQPESSPSMAEMEQGNQSQPSATIATAASSRPRRQGRPSGSKNWQPPPPTPSELALERDIEEDVQYVLNLNDTPTDTPRAESSTAHGALRDGPSWRPSVADADDRANDPTAPVTAAWQSTPEAPRPEVTSNVGNTDTISLSPTIHPTEFDDDPEVSICLLSETESAIKERIWVDENAEWLRKDSMKRVKKELKEKERREKGGGDEGERKGGKAGRRKKPPRMGDVGYLDRPEGGEEGEGGGDEVVGPDGVRRRERSASESVRRMMDLRAPTLSRRLNRDVLETLFGEGSSSQGDSGSLSRNGSRSISVVSSVPTEVSGIGGRQRQHDRSRKSHVVEMKETSKGGETAITEQVDETSASASPTPPPEDGRRPIQTTLGSVSRPASGTTASTGPVAEPSATRAGQTRKQHQQASTKSPPPAPPNQSALPSTNDDEVLGSVDDSELSSPISSRNSPMLGIHGHGFGAGDEDEDESEGDEDDYIDDDVDAALEGRSSRRRRDVQLDLDEEDVDLDVDD